MIIIRLYGGLGNQLFQYACARSVSIQKNTTVLGDISVLTKKSAPAHATKFELELFNVKISTNSKYLPLISLAYSNSRALRFIFQRWPLVLFKEKKLYKYDSKISSILGNLYLDGYWQSPKYFDNIRPELLEEIKFKKPPSADFNDWQSKIKSSNSVALHVRRGDYLTNAKAAAYHGICSTTYYEAAINRIIEKVTNPKFFIFSDDLDWCAANLNIKAPCQYVRGSSKGLSAQEDLLLMASCKHQIIANSSFSWWAAWLNENPEKIVIHPRRWITNTKVITDELFPSSWQGL